MYEVKLQKLEFDEKEQVNMIQTDQNNLNQTQFVTKNNDKNDQKRLNLSESKFTKFVQND